MRRRTRRFPSAALALGVAAAAACGDATGGEGFTVTDSAGVEIVASTAPAWPGDARPLGAPEVTIGVVGGAAAYQLDRVESALRLPDGRIVILNEGSSELRFYDARGRHLRTVGGAGEGPGEYRRLAGAVGVDDSLLVFDAALARLSVLDLDGVYGRSFRIEPTADPIRPARMYRLAGILGDTALVMLASRFPANMRPRPMIYWDSVPNLLYARDGTLLGRIGPPSGMEIEARTEPRQSAGSRPFGRVSAAAVGGDRLHYGDADDFTIEVYDGAPRLRRLIRLPGHQPARVADRWREIYERRTAELDPAAGREAQLRSYFADADLPEREPGHGPDMAVAEDGGVWIERYAHYWSGRTPAWDVFDPSGRWLGAVQPPSDLDVYQVGPWGLLAGWRDELDVEYVSLWPPADQPR